MDCFPFHMPSRLQVLVLLALLTVISGITSGCASRREFFSAAPRRPSSTAGAVDTSRGDRAAERVKEAIKSLGREISRRRQPNPDALANLPPIPLIKPLAHERMLGTSGVWSVVQTTQTAQPGPLLTRTHGQSWRDRARLSRGSIWLVLLAAAAAAILALRAQSSRRRFHG
jgi:hypothetical protein